MPLKTYRDDLPSINLTSLIDVLFLLIIFFMVGTKFSDLERKIELSVPQVSAAGPLTEVPAKRLIHVYRDGQILLDGEAVNIDELVERLTKLRTEHPGVGVVVRGDAEGAFQNVAAVLAGCRRAGVRDLGISVRLAGKEPAP